MPLAGDPFQVKLGQDFGMPAPRLKKTTPMERSIQVWPSFGSARQFCTTYSKRTVRGIEWEVQPGKIVKQYLTLDIRKLVPSRLGWKRQPTEERFAAG